MASICNDERGAFGVMSGHERKTLRLSAGSRGRQIGPERFAFVENEAASAPMRRVGPVNQRRLKGKLVELRSELVKRAPKR